METKMKKTMGKHITEKISKFFLCSMSKLQKLLNFMAPFYDSGLTASRLVPLQGSSLLFTTKFPEITGTHFIDLG